MLKEFYRIGSGIQSSRKREVLKNLLDNKVFEFIDENVNFEKAISVVESENLFNIDMLENEQDSIINIERINNVRWINKSFEKINTKLKEGGVFIGCLETYAQRRDRILAKHRRILSYPIYGLDFIVKRVFPKLKITQGLYFFLTRGNNRAISRMEAYGRLYSCGFKLAADKEIKGISYFVFRKTGKPKYEYEPTYGPLIKLKRIGKNGKIIYVRKLRTMYSFSEFLQDFVYYKHNLAEGGKFKNDIRITPWGRIMRKLWIDELPMLFNWFKGDLKLVGVRPLSEHYYSLYDKDLQEQRIRVKPGLVPPYYADMPKTLEEIMDSERRYLDAFEKHPLRTQWRYLWKAFYNIVFKKARSR